MLQSQEGNVSLEWTITISIAVLVMGAIVYNLALSAGRLSNFTENTVSAWTWDENGVSYQGGSKNTGGSTPTPTPAPTAAPTATPAPASFTSQLAVHKGYQVSCAISNTGDVRCWGQNSNGELGDGTTIEQLTPVDTSALAVPVSMLSGGLYHACLLNGSGGVQCWGTNSFGELGNNSTASSIVPVNVDGLAGGVTAVEAGYSFSCAITGSGGVKCWGLNNYGQLGDGTTSNRTVPVDVSGLTSGVAAISLGYEHACALTTSGGVKCWGRNWGGQLGDGTTSNRSAPVDVSGLTSGVAAISASIGAHSCALTSAGGVKCWGDNVDGALGDGTTTRSLSPVDVSGLGSGVAAIDTGGYHTCAITTAGVAVCWGRNDGGQLGDGSTTRRLAPVNVSGLASGVAAISSGYDHVCALTGSGAVRCWGWNWGGGLGNGTYTNSSTPVDVAISW